MMDFIMRNIGWFVGLGAILLLALIGYFADKNDTKEKNNGIKKENDFLSDVNDSSTEALNEDNLKIPLEPIAVNEFNDKNNFNDNDQFDYNTVNSLDNNSVISDSIGSDTPSSNDIDNSSKILPEFKVIEDINMSLEDLENKNYNAILNSKTESNDVIDDISVSKSDEFNSIKVDDNLAYNLNSNDDFVSTDIDTKDNLNNEVISGDLPINDINVTQDTNAFDLQNNVDNYINDNQINDNQISGNQNGDTSDFQSSGHEFDSEIDSGDTNYNADSYEQVSSDLNDIDNSSIPELGSNSYNYDDIFNNYFNSETTVPEITNFSSNNAYDSGFYNDSEDDDIWKF